jgi:hypothetical protein
MAECGYATSESLMKIIIPSPTICTNVVAVSIPVTEPLYSAATTYDKDDKVTKSVCGANVYQSLTSSNLDNDPEDPASIDWLWIGASNAFAMFDSKNGTQSVYPDIITAEVGLTEITNAVALINVNADLARFEAWDEGGILVMDETFNLREYGVTSMYDYYFEEITLKDRLVAFNVPALIAGSKGKLTLTSNTAGADVKLGSLVYGKQFSIGDSQYGISLSIKDYSTKELDIFGNYTIIERSFQNVMDAQITVANEDIAQVKKVLAANRSTPLVWVADQNKEETIVYGYYRDFSITLPHTAYAECRLRTEGLT